MLFLSDELKVLINATGHQAGYQDFVVTKCYPTFEDELPVFNGNIYMESNEQSYIYINDIIEDQKPNLNYSKEVNEYPIIIPRIYVHSLGNFSFDNVCLGYTKENENNNNIAGPKSLKDGKIIRESDVLPVIPADVINKTDYNHFKIGATLWTPYVEANNQYLYVNGSLRGNIRACNFWFGSANLIPYKETNTVEWIKGVEQIPNDYGIHIKIDNNTVDDDTLRVIMEDFASLIMSDQSAQFPTFIVTSYNSMFNLVAAVLDKPNQEDDIYLWQDNSTIQDYQKYESAVMILAERWREDTTRSRVIQFDYDYVEKGGGYVEYTDTIALIDECNNVDYYISWIDRMGGWQCQPVSGKVIYSEDLTRNYITDSRYRKQLINVDVEAKWDLNTGFVDEKLYKTFESLFVSPNVWLYETKKDKLYEVNISDKTYTEKTFRNEKKLFGVHFNAEIKSTQNILY